MVALPSDQVLKYMGAIPILTIILTNKSKWPFTDFGKIYFPKEIYKDVTEIHPNIYDSLKKYNWGNKNKFKSIKEIN